MKVVLLAFGGDPHYFTLLCQALSQNNFVTAVCPPNMVASEFMTPSHYIELPLRSAGLLAAARSIDPRLLRSVLKAVGNLKPDVVHIVFELRFPAILGNWLHKSNPMVITIHEPEPFFSDTWLRRRVINPLVTLNNSELTRSSDIAIVHGSAHKNLLVGRGIAPSKIEIVPHGSLSFFEKWEDKGIGTGAEEHTVLFLGRIWPYKGIEYLLQAAATIQADHPETKFVIAGSGNFAPYRSLAGRVKRLALINRFLSDREAAELIQSASLMVFPYVAGSQTGWISAAYALRKPVVATATGNFAELVQDNRTGFIVPPRDASALAAAISSLLDNNELAQTFGSAGHELMVREMSWENVAGKTLRAYLLAVESRQNLRVGD